MDGIGQVTAVVFVMVSLAGCLWLLRAKGLATFSALHTRRRAGALDLVERLPLSAQHSLYLVRFRERELLVAVSGASCTIHDPSSTLAVSR